MRALLRGVVLRCIGCLRVLPVATVQGDVGIYHSFGHTKKLGDFGSRHPGREQRGSFAASRAAPR